MALICKHFIVLCVILRALGENSENSSEETEEILTPFESSRALRDDFMNNKWRAVDAIPLDTSGWIPEPNPQVETLKTPQDQEVPKRRRIRKRKRRPPTTSSPENEDAKTIPSRRRRPQLEEHQPWNEMVQEARITPNKRRRVIPSYHTVLLEEKDLVGREGTQTEKGITTDKTPEKDLATEKDVPDRKSQTEKERLEMEEEVLNLKMLLKQAGSLSEILQKRNLTLSDLLKGEKKAIYALTERTDDVESITEYKNPVEPEKEIEIITKPPEIVREVKVKTSFINNRHNNMKYDVNPSSENNERTTKLGNIIVIDYKPQFVSDFSIESSTTSQEDVSTRKPGLKKSQTAKLPVTNAKLNKYSIPKLISTKNEIPRTPEPPKPYKISVSEILGIAKEMMVTHDSKDTRKEDEPLRMSLDLNKVFEEKRKIEEAAEGITTENTRTTEFMKITDFKKTTPSVIPEKIQAITAKDEIFEILKDMHTKENLTKILKNRNMTIDDLVALRERGSSQKHLADLFHNKTKEPEPVEKVYVGQFINVNPSERIPKSRRPTETPIEETSDNLEENQDKSKYTITSFPTYKIEMDKKYKEVLSEQIWKDYDKLYHNTHQKGTVENLSDFEDVQSIDDEITSNGISERGNEKLSIDVEDKFQDDDGNIFIKLPYGVKHAILASLLIIGISLFIFVTILIIFKWSQKHKRKLCYSGSFSCSKFNSILENGEKRTFRTFVSETLGRKKHFYKQHLQSMSDTWENDKKPFQ